MHGIEHMRLFRSVALVAGAFLLLVHAAGAQSVNPSSVVDTYARAWGQRDVDVALSLFAEDAVVSLQDAHARVLGNRDQIREFLQEATLKPAPQLTSPRQVDGNIVRWNERTEGQVISVSDVTVQAVVQNGKIQSLVYRPGRMVRPPGDVPMSESTLESAGLALGSVVLLGLGLLSLATVRSRVRSGSQLRGRLLSELRRWPHREASF
jgi:hypothetical protein